MIKIHQNFDTFLCLHELFAEVKTILNGPPIFIGNAQLCMSYYLPGVGGLNDEQYQHLRQNNGMYSKILNITTIQFQHQKIKS